MVVYLDWEKNNCVDAQWWRRFFLSANNWVRTGRKNRSFDFAEILRTE
jgi:hypothetical protein